MNISYKWLKRYIDTDLTPEKVAEALTSLGLEVGAVEQVETIKGGLRGLVVGQVVTCIDHPNSDHLHITTVDLGDGNDPVQIVCGAPNVAAGQKVIVATIGTKLYDGDKEFTIKRSKMRGEESLGMICAEDEIGVGTSHDGIIVLPEDAVVGTPAAEYYGIEDDYLIEVDLTPNRIDGGSHYGVARDLAAWMRRHGMDGNLHKPSVDNFASDRADGGIPVTVENAEACPRYAGLTVRGTGQPMHCFDLSKVKGDRIVVKTVEPGTKFVTLDGVERTLTDRDLMICNGEEPMCIGGVFGGLDSGVTEATTDVFLESAYFHPTWIRKTARRFGLNTDASFRFERGIDPNEVIYNLKLAAMLVKELAGGEICGDIIDVKAHDFPGFPVELRYDYVTGLIGKDIPHDVIRDIVKSLEMEITAEDDEKMQLVVPTYRVDVQRPCDVVEDILRVYGYNNIELTNEVHSSLSNKTEVDWRDDMQETVSNQLTSVGYHEIMNNSLTVGAYYEGLETYPADKCVRIMNPLSSDLNVMRQTLLFGGLESIARNINHKNPNLRLYEFGNVYSHDGSISQEEKALAPYSESTQMAMWMTGNNHDESWADKVRALNVYDLKADLENMLANMGFDPKVFQIHQYEDETINPALVYSVYDYMLRDPHKPGTKDLKMTQIAVMGVVDEALAKKFDIDQPVYYAQINWTAACKLAMNRDIKYYDLPKTLPLRRDLALLVDRSVTYDDIRQVVEKSERKLLKSMTLFDVYESNKLEAGKKSYAISMILQDNEKTLNDKQIDAIMSKIIKNLETELGAKLR